MQDLSIYTPNEIMHFQKETLDQLDNAQATTHQLYFWESPQYFVVLGASNKAEIEANVPNCEEDHIPIIKRISGGGTVLQGPGCLNYELFLPMTIHPELAQIQSSNAFIMHEMAKALQPLSQEKIAVKGYTDLAINGQKFSGNAQRRKRHALLFHGTILIDFDLEKVHTYLAHPSKEPDYRLGRSHQAFIRNFGSTRDDIKMATQAHWDKLVY